MAFFPAFMAEWWFIISMYPIFFIPCGCLCLQMFFSGIMDWRLQPSVCTPAALLPQLVVKPQLPRINQDCRGVVTLGLAQNWRWMLELLVTLGLHWGLIRQVLTLFMLPADHLQRSVGQVPAVLPPEGRFCHERYLIEYMFWGKWEGGPEVAAV